jgi:excisionase family DNA binding protein
METTHLQSSSITHTDDNMESLEVIEEQRPTRPMQLPHISSVLTIPEVAEILRLSPHTVKRLVERGKIKAARTGDYAGRWRISANAVEKFLEGLDE